MGGRVKSRALETENGDIEKGKIKTSRSASTRTLGAFPVVEMVLKALGYNTE
jgi:hypothetical protein